MADNNNKTTKDTPLTPSPSLPSPKNDVWGRDLPLPETPTKEDEDKKYDDSKSIEAAELLVENFEKYIGSIKASNQNFLMKASRIFVNDFKRGVIEGMLESAKETDQHKIFDSMQDELNTANERLEELIQKQEDANKIDRLRLARDAKRDEAAKKKDAEDKENQREKGRFERIKGFFFGDDDDKKKKKDKKGSGLLGGLMDMFGGGILGTAIAVIAPLLAGFSLFFVDFEKLLKNPMWDKISKLIKEKIIPGVFWLFEEVLGPLADFLFNTTLPAVVDGLIATIDDISKLFTDIAAAFNADNIGDGIRKGFKALFDFAVNIGDTLLTMVLEGLGFDADAFKQSISQTMDKTIGAFTKFFTGMLDGVTEFWVGISDVVVGLWQGDMDKFKDGVKTAVLGLIQSFTAGMFGLVDLAVNAVMDAFGMEGEAFDLAEEVARIPTLIKDFVKNMFNSVIDFFTQTKDRVGEISASAIVPDIVGSINRVFNSIFTTVKDKMIAISDDVMSYFGDISSFTADLLASIPVKINELFTKLKTWVVDGFFGAWDTLKGMFTTGIVNVEEASDRIKTKVTDAFWSLIDSIKDAVVSAIVSVKDYFLDLPARLGTYLSNSIKNAVKDYGGETLYNWFFEEGEEAPTLNRNVAPVSPAPALGADTPSIEGNLFDMETPASVAKPTPIMESPASVTKPAPIMDVYDEIKKRTSSLNTEPKVPIMEAERVNPKTAIMSKDANLSDEVARASALAGLAMPSVNSLNTVNQTFTSASTTAINTPAPVFNTRRGVFE